jgi:hypothetical protein
MKRNYISHIIFLAGIFSMQAYAQAPVVLQHNGASTIFPKSSGFSDAYNAAVHGDTIYLPGGFFDGLTINKKIAIIGAGHHPDSTSATYATQINGSLTLGADTDSAHIEGLHITGNINTIGNNKMDRLRIRRNMIDGALSLDGDKSTPSINDEVSGNVIRGSVDLSNTLSVVLCNNVFQSRVHYVFQGSISNNVFANNPILPQVGYYNNVYDCDYSKIENNVFVHPNGPIGFANCDNSIINNNLFAMAIGNVYYVNNFPLGNYTDIATANVFINWTSSSYLYSDDYHLKLPATYLGIDGTQVGIYGGLRPWKEGSIPLNPHIQAKTIATNTDAEGKIQVQVKVSAQNN